MVRVSLSCLLNFKRDIFYLKGRMMEVRERRRKGRERGKRERKKETETNRY